MKDAASIKGDDGAVALQILGYENAQAQSVDDSNWLGARLEVQGGPFVGVIMFAITAPELARLCQQVKEVTKNVSGKCPFQYHGA